MTNNPVDDLLPVIAEAVEQWRTANDPVTIKSKVKRELDESSKEIMVKLLGFSRDYRGYSLDHCNGRSGNSPAGDFIIQAQAEAVKEWLSTVAMPVLTEAEKETLETSCRKHYVDYFRRSLIEQVRKKAQSDAAELINLISQSNNFDKYQELLKLISPE